jgi:phosphatidylserine/phosphatidylglycerophosphate/cardiolipin synthase-like enzyme
VKVSVLTNSLAATDEPVVHVGYARYRDALLHGGVDLYELSPKRIASSERLRLPGASLGSLHAKAAVIDERRIFIGSTNLDPRSDSTNTELGIFADCPGACARNDPHLEPQQADRRLSGAARCERRAWSGCRSRTTAKWWCRRSRKSRRGCDSRRCCSLRSCLSSCCSPFSRERVAAEGRTDRAD